ncbi:cytochrome c1 [Pelomonas sp. KK5]|uniref:cytochrome c1 n=1 Tax=Pelomonas sp. KK5 TaxID=1855730 RepID=UPI00097CBC22|nr:cytochrome c1 [Pelomonas sp. KK5]
MTKKFIATLLIGLGLLGLQGGAQANEGGAPWDKFPTYKMEDMAALQNGAKLFVNYCLNCHQASFMRYNRLHDIGLTDQQIKDNMLFSGGKVGDLMRTTLDPKQAKEWFGAVPPDLSVIARSRSGERGSGADYLYTYLRTFYRDETKATGWNNVAFPSVAMPHVLWELQGVRVPKIEEIEDPHEHGLKTHVITGFDQVTPGKMTPRQFDDAVGDLVAYLQWMGEPAQSERFRLGVIVLLFLSVLTVFAWRLNAAYWKDVK